jgi:hypothetical protein
VPRENSESKYSDAMREAAAGDGIPAIVVREGGGRKKTAGELDKDESWLATAVFRYGLRMETESPVGRGQRCDGMLVDENIAVDLHQHGKVVEGLDVPLKLLP